MATATVNYGSVREAREHFKDLLDAADEGRPATVTRDSRRVAAVDADATVLNAYTGHHRVDQDAPELPWAVHLAGRDQRFRLLAFDLDAKTDPSPAHRDADFLAGLLEEVGIANWRSAGAVDRTEWVSQIRTATTIFGPYQLQEASHASYWGQLAMRNCLRQAYNGGVVRGGRCVRVASGLNAAGEPQMGLQ